MSEEARSPFGTQYAENKPRDEALRWALIATQRAGVRESLGRRDLSGGHFLVIGVVGGWFVNNCRHLFNWSWRYLGQPGDMINHPFVAFLIFALATFGVMHLMAKDAIEGQIPRENWIRLGQWIAVGVALAGAVILWLEPSPHH